MFKPLCPIKSQIESALKLYCNDVLESSSSSAPNLTQFKMREGTPPPRVIKEVSNGELTSQRLSYDFAAVKTAERNVMTTKTRADSSRRDCTSGVIIKEDKTVTAAQATENGVVRKIQNIVQNQLLDLMQSQRSLKAGGESFL